jgi:inorganic pyrophosphatase
MYELQPIYELNSKEYRLFMKQNDKKISFWHDIKYKVVTNDQNVNTTEYTCVIEIPKNTSDKFELCTKEPYNPIRHDLNKDDSLRKYPYPIRWNYGFIPQTWEDPSRIEKDVENLYGDNDPIDIVEIGSVVHHTGTVIRVKVLGAFSMIDEGELDWKIVVIDCNDPIASSIKSDEDVKRHIGDETLKEIQEWFRHYKNDDSTRETVRTRFGHNEKFVDIQTAINAVEKTHSYWKDKFSI